MITWSAPIAFVLLVVPAILWWLHRREPRPAVVIVPTLMFLAGEKQTAEESQRRRIDGDLLLALAAAAALCVAAAGPVVGGAVDGRRLTVLVDASPAMAARSADGTTASDRAWAASSAIRSRMRAIDRFEAVAASGGELFRRLRDTTAGLRVLVSDRRPPELPVGAVFAGVGDATSSNAGIVALDVDVVAGRRRVYATIWNDAPSPRTLRAGPVGRETDVPCPSRGAARASWDLGPIPAGGVAHPITIHVIDDDGALGADDDVILDPAPIRVAFARERLAPAVEAATRRALDAIFIGGWQDDPTADRGIFFGPAQDAPIGASSVVEIGRVPSGVEPTRPAGRDAVAPVDPELVRDLELDSVDWLYPPGVDAHAPWPRISVDRTHLPSRVVVRWHADPSLGRPAAIEAPLWPLFIENVIRLAGGAPGASGRRWTGVLDPDVTRLGRDVVAFDEATLDAAPRDVVARRETLAPALATLATICLAVLWFRPRKGATSPVR